MKEKHNELQITIRDQEITIAELERLKNESIEELEDLKSIVGYKTDQLNEWKQKYEVKFCFANNLCFILVLVKMKNNFII